MVGALISSLKDYPTHSDSTSSYLHRRDAMAELDSQAPLLQPLLEHAGYIKTKPVGEHYASLGFRIYA